MIKANEAYHAAASPPDRTSVAFQVRPPNLDHWIWQVKLHGEAAGSGASQYASCCVVTKNVNRSMFVLPRKTGEVDDDGKPKRYSWDLVHKEVTSLLVPSCIPRREGQGFKCKVVKRK